MSDKEFEERESDAAVEAEEVAGAEETEEIKEEEASCDAGSEKEKKNSSKKEEKKFKAKCAVLEKENGELKKKLDEEGRSRSCRRHDRGVRRHCLFCGREFC